MWSFSTQNYFCWFWVTIFIQLGIELHQIQCDFLISVITEFVVSEFFIHLGIVLCDIFANWKQHFFCFWFVDEFGLHGYGGGKYRGKTCRYEKETEKWNLFLPFWDWVSIMSTFSVSCYLIDDSFGIMWLESHGFKPWELPLAKMQNKEGCLQCKPLWFDPSSDSAPTRS